MTDFNKLRHNDLIILLKFLYRKNYLQNIIEYNRNEIRFDQFIIRMTCLTYPLDEVSSVFLSNKKKSELSNYLKRDINYLESLNGSVDSKKLAELIASSIQFHYYFNDIISLSIEIYESPWFQQGDVQTSTLLYKDKLNKVINQNVDEALSFNDRMKDFPEIL